MAKAGPRHEGTLGTGRRPWRPSRRDLVNAPFGNIVGGWYRADAYEVRDGYIRPRERAEIVRYDPWHDFRGRHRGEDAPCAYDALRRLVDAAERDPVVASSSIPAWCAQYGLLGVLPHRTHSISLAARWEHPAAPIPKDQVWPVWRRYVRSSDRWVEVVTLPQGFREAFANPGSPPAGFPIASRDETGQLVPRPLCGEGWGQPEVVLRVPLAPRPEDDLGVEQYQHQPPSATWGRYFPTVPLPERDTFPYPNPQTDAFWHLYAEPVAEFMTAARQLRDGLRELDRVWFPERPDDLMVLESMAMEGQGLVRLHMLAAPLKVALAWDRLTDPMRLALTPTAGDRYRQVWVASSLLSSLAAMALLDRVGTPPRCKFCGKDIVPGKAVGLYCSRKCGEAVKKDRQRRRDKGEPLPVIRELSKRSHRSKAGG